MSAVRIRVTGAVQGVGFRPFCYREAARRGLAGFVLNDLGGVRIVLEGPQESIDDFLETLRMNPPPASRISEILVEETTPSGLEGFRIVESEQGLASQSLEVSADLATCEDCRREILDAADRRLGYAFTNCTNCGPRYTIIRELPYDRPKTTMAEFRMCGNCRIEYEDPADRRFHAQPNACHACGPEVVLLDSSGRVTKCNDPVMETARLLGEGKIVAVKGLGGYHLMCDAVNLEAVRQLRKRKRRPDKALALMAKDAAEARKLAVIGENEEALLRSPQAPILLLDWAEDVPREIREAIAPLNPGVGIMLAYTPLHHLLFAAKIPPVSHADQRRSLGVLVATSANCGDEPIIADECELIERLSGVADAVLAHNRPVENRIDDSVGFLFPSDPPDREENFGRPASPVHARSRNRLFLIRRARGFAPQPFESSFDFEPILAVGAEMKGSFALAEGRRVWLSPHIGEVTNRATIEFFEHTLATYMRWFRVKPGVVACDMHPDYLSTRWAERYALKERVPLIRVAHHHAHTAAVMFEHRVEEPVIGLSLDGTGYGPDGSIWGCELLHVTEGGAVFKRIGHLRELPLVGGDAAVQSPLKMAAGVTAELFGEGKTAELFGNQGILVSRQLESGVGVIRASSAGRLFDAVAGLVGLVEEITFEAQAPIALESLCPRVIKDKGYPFEIGEDMVLDPRPAFEAIIEDISGGVEEATVSARFHMGFASALISWLLRAAELTGTRTVACSGGVFANRVLIRLLSEEGARKNLKMLFPELIPSTDGGLAAGQLLVAHKLSGL